MSRGSYLVVRSILLASSLMAAACGSDSLSCRQARTCLAKDGDSCGTNDDCASGYCGTAVLPYSADPYRQICREKPSCELDDCTVCARLGELGREDGPKDKAVCIDECGGDLGSNSCSLCGCPAHAECDAKTDRCAATLPPLLNDGSVCAEDEDCVNKNCRTGRDENGQSKRLCASLNESSCKQTPCYGGTCWDDVAYTGAVCLAACEADADCQSTTGASFACVKLETGSKECRLTCDSNNCGGIDGVIDGVCSKMEDAAGKMVSICPGQN
jgi:hypothetical protein